MLFCIGVVVAVVVVVGFIMGCIRDNMIKSILLLYYCIIIALQLFKFK
jgi:hypothetical protein